MKLIYTLLISAALLCAPVLGKGKSSGKTKTKKASTHVTGYTKKDGTVVDGHVRSDPNETERDNYSTKGNVNPVTGKEGTKEQKK